MSVADWPQIHQAGVAAFYAAGHDWTWVDMQQGNTPGAIATSDWLTQSPTPPEHPLLLPRVSTHDGKSLIRWYAVAFSDAQLELLREQLNAFTGPAGTDYHGIRATLDPDDPPEAALIEWTGGRHVFTITVIPSKRREVRETLNRLRHIWELQPAARPALLRTTEALLRELFAALTNGDEHTALRWFSELQASGRLSAENLNFLQIERLSAFGRWNEILASQHVSQLLVVARPRRITAHLVEALWQTELEPFVERGDAIGVLAWFRSEVFPRYGALFRARGGVITRPVVFAFLVAACAAVPPRREQIAQLLPLLPERDAEFGAALVALVPPPAEVAREQAASPLEAARAALLADDFETAWRLAQNTPISSDVLRLMIECAVEIATPEAAHAVQEAFAALPTTEAEQVLSSPRRRRAFEELRKLAGPGEAPPPIDWETWFERLDADPTWPRLLEVAHEAPQLWPLSNYLHAPQRVGDLAGRLLATRESAPENVLRFAMPRLLTYFLPDGVAQSAFLPLYGNLLLLLALGERFAQTDWSTAQTLLGAILEAGPNGPVYAEAVTAQMELWQQFGAANRLDWGLDALDLLVTYPCPDTAAREAFYDTIRETFAREYRRIRNEYWELFRLLSADLGRNADFEALRSLQPTVEPSAVEIGIDLSGRMIGIYTLTASAGAHAKATIEKLFPGVDVRLNHDVVGSERLKSLAREADYFVVATRSAAHAATGFVKENRPARAMPLIYPSGKGASSIVTGLVAAVGMGDAR